MNEFIETAIPVVLTSDVELAEAMGKTSVEYDIVRARISLRNIRTIHESRYADETSVVGIEYHDGDDTTIIDSYDRIIKLHDQYLKTNNLLFTRQ